MIRAASHHGDDELTKRFLDQIERRAKREYTHGRLGGADEGSLALAIRADKERRVVVIDFGKPVEWIGLAPADVNGLISLLVKKMQELGEIVSVGV